MNRLVNKQWRGARKKPIPQTCLFCDLVLSTPFNLEYHLRTHTQEQPYFCSYCDETFRSLWSKTNHENNIHLGIKEKCPKCGRSFNNGFGLRNHLKRVHGGCGLTQEGEAATSTATADIIEGPAISTCGPSDLPVERTTNLSLPPPPSLHKIENLKKVEDNNKLMNKSKPPPLRLFDFPVILPKAVPVGEEPKWDPSFFLHMNRYKMEEEEESSTILASSSNNVETGCSEVSEAPPRRSNRVSKLESSKQAVKLGGIPKVKRRQTKKLLVKKVKSNISEGREDSQK